MHAGALLKGPVSREHKCDHWNELLQSHPRSGAWGESESTDLGYSRS